jgi:hypothetical protein
VYTLVELGLVKFATIALPVGQAALPADRSKFSKHQLTPPQLLAMLCQRRDEDWTFRDAEVRLAEHTNLRTALRLPHAPDSTPVYRFLRRSNDTAREDTLSAVVQRLGRQFGLQAPVAVDATGLVPGAISPFCATRAKARGEGFPWRHWLKWTIVVDSDHRLMLAQTARRGPTNDCAILHPLVSTAQARGPVGMVLADAKVDNERKHRHIRQTLQAQSIIPAKRGALADSGCMSPHMPGLSRGPLLPTFADRKPHLRREAATLSPSTGPLSPDVVPAGVAARDRLQQLSPAVFCIASSPEDVNRAK